MYELSELFLYKTLFMIEMLVAIFLYTYKLPKKNKYILRLIIYVIVTIGLSIAIPIITYNTWYLSGLFLVMFLIILGGVFFLYDIEKRVLIFAAIMAYTAQHLAHELYNLLVVSFNLVVGDATLGLYGSSTFSFSELDSVFFLKGLIYINIYLLVYGAIYFFVGKKIDKPIANNNTNLLWLSGVLLLVDILLNALVVYITDGYSKIYSIITTIYNLLCCSMVIYIQRQILNTKQLEMEVEITSQLLQKEREQFQKSKENNDMINMKCHDLKHQIRKAYSLNNNEVNELDKLISIYDSNVNTGNEASDIIIKEKSLLCNQNNINFSVLADCSCLEFMDNSDIYSLFGNAIDNAIEATLPIKNKEKRTISLNVRKIKNFVTINIENYFEGNIVFDEKNLPITTKSDKNFHGFGLKSIRYIVEKYKGNIEINTTKETFRLSILLPLKQN